MIPYVLFIFLASVRLAFAENCCSHLVDLGVPVSDVAGPYYSLHQADMQPACIVHPTSAAQISSIMKLSNADCEFEFAVRCGGHLTWRGASNVDAPGFTIDMAKFNDLEYDEETQQVTFGAGLLWGDVYGFLAPLNRTVRGGRYMSVGVSGFLLGGGISFPAQTFASSTVIEFEVVLASGDIVRVNKSTNPDLFWALKRGSTNYGILTRITMQTMEDDDVWGCNQVFPLESTIDILLAEIIETAEDPDTQKSVRALVLSSEGPSTIVFRAAHAHHPLPDIGVPAIVDTFVAGKRPDVWKLWEGQEAAEAAYHKWTTLTIVPDASFVRRVFEKGTEIYTRRSIALNISVQPLPGSLFEDGQPALLLIFASNKQDEDMKDLFDWTSSHKEMIKPYVYLNYASGDQDVYGDVDLQRYWDVKNKYDPQNLLGKHWAGGFKLPRMPQHDEL